MSWISLLLYTVLLAGKGRRDHSIAGGVSSSLSSLVSPGRYSSLFVWRVSCMHMGPRPANEGVRAPEFPRRIAIAITIFVVVWPSGLSVRRRNGRRRPARKIPFPPASRDDGISITSRSVRCAPPSGLAIDLRADGVCPPPHTI